MQPKASATHSSDTTDDRKVVVPSRPGVGLSDDRDAAARLVRQQIDRLYDSAPPFQIHTEQAGPTPQLAGQTSTEHDSHVPAAYGRTHSNEGLTLSMGGQTEAWDQYHSAWQSYYQQYYQRYYLQQLSSTREKLQKQAGTTKPEDTKPQWLASADTKKEIYSDDMPGAVTDNALPRNQAATELKNRLLAKVKSRAKAIRKSHHFMPLASALAVGGIFGLLQYNQLIQAQIRTYVSPGNISPQNIIVDPNSLAAVSPEPRLIIPKTNVDAPINFDVESLKEDDIQAALKKGVVHYSLPGADSRPGQIGNNVILGHSSNDVFDDGLYKFVFVLNERLEVGDSIFINYEGKRYTYSVTKKEVVKPSEVGKLVYPTNKPFVSLVSCVPVGTAANRLIITAEQISPDPSAAIAAPSAPTRSSQTVNLPDTTSPSFLERVFGR